jgi:exosome complex component RRP42
MSTLFAFLSSQPQLNIIQHKKAWLIHLDALVLSADGGNLYDALIIAARSALWDLKLPKTRGIGYNSAPNLAEDEENQERDVDMVGFSALLKGGKRGKGNEIDFELESYWDEGEPLQDRELLPVSVTLNLVGLHMAPSVTELTFEKDGSRAVSGCHPARGRGIFSTLTRSCQWAR